MKHILNEDPSFEDTAGTDSPQAELVNLNQHFLKDQTVIDTIIAASEIADDETALEIGPGTGALTLALAKYSRHVIAIEKDRRLAGVLGRYLEAHPNVEVVYGDATNMRFPNFDRLVANIPFNITEPLIMNLLETRFRSATLLVGRRFGEQFESEEYNHLTRLGILGRAYFQTQYIADVPKTAFEPIPGTDCSIIHLEPIKKKELAQRDFRLYLVRCLWDQKRRPLCGAIQSALEQYAVAKGAENPKISEKTLRQFKGALGSYWAHPVGGIPNWQFREFYKALSSVKPKTAFNGHKPRGGAKNWRQTYDEYLE